MLGPGKYRSGRTSFFERSCCDFGWWILLLPPLKNNSKHAGHALKYLTETLVDSPKQTPQEVHGVGLGGTYNFPQQRTPG